MGDLIPVVFEMPDLPKDEEVFGERLTVGGLYLEDRAVTPIWNASKVVVEERELYESPSSAIFHDNHLFLGLNTGVVKKITVSGSQVVDSFDRRAVDPKYMEWDMFHDKPSYEKHQAFLAELEERAKTSPDIAKLLEERKDEKGRAHMFGISFVLEGYHRIRSLVEHDGTVYDAGSTGFFKTETGEQLCDAYMHSAVVVNGKLCHVPYFESFLKWIESGKRGAFKHAHSLVDTETGNILMPDIIPNRGHGNHYLASGENAYIYDNGPHLHKLIIKSFPNNHNFEKITKRTVDESRGFIEWDGRVFDLRKKYGRGKGPNITGLVESNEPFDSVEDALVAFESEKKPITSMVSAGEKGILMTVWDLKSGTIKIISHLDPETPLFETDSGHFRFL